jgi:hypothetical protein
MASEPEDPEPCDVVPFCPICGGKMDTVYKTAKLYVCVCVDCFASLSIPAESWEVARRKREAAQKATQA